MSDSASSSEPEFVPKGSVVFFAALVVFFGAAWLGLYLLMAGRQAP